MGSKQVSKQVQDEARTSEGRFPPGVCPNPHGRGAPAARAKADEQKRQAVAAELERDLGRTPSAAERLLIESIASQAVEARKLRRQGRSSEMQDRLVYRGLAKLGIKEGAASPRLSYAERRALEIAAQKTAEGQGVADACKGY